MFTREREKELTQDRLDCYLKTFYFMLERKIFIISLFS